MYRTLSVLSAHSWNNQERCSVDWCWNVSTPPLRLELHPQGVIEQFGQRTSARQPNMDRSITPKVTITESQFGSLAPAFVHPAGISFML